MFLSVFGTNVVVSKGYEGKPALRFGGENNSTVRFRVGCRVYDSNAENNTRWINLSMKAFGKVCEQIKKMDLKDGSWINFIGRLDEDKWEDKESGDAKSQMVIILDKIEYAGGGSGKSKDKDQEAAPGGYGMSGGYGAPPAPGDYGPVGGYPGSYGAPGGYPASGAYGAPPVNNPAAPPMTPPPAQAAPPAGFTGYESFGGNNLFDMK